MTKTFFLWIKKKLSVRQTEGLVRVLKSSSKKFFLESRKATRLMKVL